ncbi:MAG: FAD-binding oxidoreductase [Acidimicrobiales bacterium]
MTDPRPGLLGNAECDVAVIGGGLTGMVAALRLAERGIDVSVLESKFCGWGSSSRNAGHLTPTIAGDPQVLATVYRRRAPELIRMADNAVHFAEKMIERLDIECEYDATGNVSAALTRGQLRRSERIAHILRNAGGEVDFVMGNEWGLPPAFVGGVLERSGGILNPGKLARGVRDVVLASNAKVYEQTPVEVLDSDNTGVRLRTPCGQIRAGRALLATNAYTRDLSFGPDRVVAPLWVTLAETEPIDVERIRETGWSSRSGVYTQHLILENYRLTPRNTIVFGTRFVQSPHGALADRLPDRAVVADLITGFRDRFPTLHDVEVHTAWSGWIAMTPSWLPVAGEVSPNIFYAMGYNGHGLAQAPYLGTLLADRIAGDSPHDDLEVLWRKRKRFAAAPMFSSPALKIGWKVDRTFDRLAERRSPK